MEEILQFIKDNSSLIPALSAAIAALSLLISAGSLAISAGSRRSSKEALELAKVQEARRHERLSVELLNAKCEPGQTDLRYTYELLISNRADRPNSVSRAELHLAYLIDRRLVTAVFPVVRGASPSTISSALTTFGANEAKEGVLQVLVPRAALSDRPVDHVILVLTDSRGATYQVRSEHIPEVEAREVHHA